MKTGTTGGNKRSYYSRPNGRVDVPLIAVGFTSSLATRAVTYSYWSVLLLLLLTTGRKIPAGKNRSRYCNSSRRIGIGGIPTVVAAAAVTKTMSGYSTLFADAFHPSASYSAKDDENETKNSPPAGARSTAIESESGDSKDDGFTCDAVDDDDESAGRPHPEDDRVLLFHHASTTSTQDEAKKIAARISSGASTPPATFCVTATSQTKGRGTTGRQWLGAPGNVFVTIGIPVDVWMTRMVRERKIPLTLLPLKVGDLTASLVRKELDGCGGGAGEAAVTVKWPNDVLVDGKKISGTLIENASDWFLIGIGINVAHAPAVPTKGADYGRPSVSLNDLCGSSSSMSSSSTSRGTSDAAHGDDSPQPSENTERNQRDRRARDLGVHLALDFHRWIYEDDPPPPPHATSYADSIVEGWKKWLDWDAELTLRNDHDKEGPRRVVKLLDVLPDGRLLVANKGDGKEEILVSDYFV